VFLDANILFSAAWRADVSPALTLWNLSDLTLLSSAYAIHEAERNLDSADRRARLYRLLRQIEIVDEPPATVTLPKRVALPVKDQPILRAAIHAKCSHLLTGDHRHFGALFGRSVKGVRIVTVREYLTARVIRD
jgi:predicted nucleic acid-binding protein